MCFNQLLQLSCNSGLGAAQRKAGPETRSDLMKSSRIIPAMTVVAVLTLAGPARAQERPYFVTYDQHLEEPGNLELGVNTTIGIPRSGQARYFAPFAEIEYGVTAWWTSEVYLETLSRKDDSTIFTGWRWENRFRPLARERRINPVLYLEYERLNEASSIQKEIVGAAHVLDEPNSELRREVANELEAKLILGSNVRDWNISENFIVEKNFSEGEGLEFGYALGIARPLATLASGSDCVFCRENFAAGLELYGGLGSSREFGFDKTAHYLAPAVSWQIGDSALRFSTGFGLTKDSAPVLVRFGYSHEIHGFGKMVSGLFRGRR
jgi:hypothetical protein